MSDNKNWTEEDLLPISALQHLIFCERQCALIHIEQLWDENRFTAEGRVMHERVHELGAEQRGRVRVARGLRIRSLELGLIGQADIVEFHRQDDGSEVPYPIEYKRGRAKPSDCDKIQLCAQALCLEEMLSTHIPEGALFYGKPHRRLMVPLDNALRASTAETAQRLHALIRSGITPTPEYERRKCEACSLYDLCRPRAFLEGGNVAQYLERMLSE
ncbi:MAG: CRISPR-associated protein Cas4 [Spartobacteria bacterium]|nr:CRISPR-associated protein Cas4 [Spartobacteria bacterium]